MGYAQQVFILSFTKLADGRLSGERFVVISKENPADRLFVSFDAEYATGQYRAYAGGLANILHSPEPIVEGPVPIFRDAIDGLRFDYTHETVADKIIAVIGFPTGWSANDFSPWPADAKRDGDRLAVLFNLPDHQGLHLQWRMQELPANRSLKMEVERIKRRETGADSEKTLIVFIHGLGGAATETWAKFPEILLKEPEFARKYELAFFSYPTMLVRTIFHRKAPAIQELAAALRTQINNRYSEFGTIVLVCHSLGGWLTDGQVLGKSFPLCNR